MSIYFRMNEMKKQRVVSFKKYLKHTQTSGTCKSKLHWDTTAYLLEWQKSKDRQEDVSTRIMGKLENSYIMGLQRIGHYWATEVNWTHRLLIRL